MKKCILLFLTIFAVLGTEGCAQNKSELTPTGYASDEVQRPQIMYNGRLYLYTAKGFDGPLPEGYEYVGEVKEVDNKHEPSSDWCGSRVEAGQRIYASKDTAVIYVEYESGYAEFAALETEAEETEIGEMEAEISEITIKSKPLSSQENNEEFDPARMLSEDSKDVCGLYLKAGDPTYQLEVKPGGRLNRNQLTFTVKKSSKEYAEIEPIRFCELPADFEHKDPGFYDTDSETNGIYIEWNDTELYIDFLGDAADEAAGRYYPAFYYFYPEAFFRPLNRADIIGMTEKDIRYLRNQFYAAHGRSFNDEELEERFRKERWYVQEEGDPESEFTDIEKRNIEFLKSIENELSESEPSTIDDAMELFTIYDDQNVLLPEEIELLNSYSIEPFTKEGLQVLNAAHSKTAFELFYNDIIKDHIDRNWMPVTEIWVELSSRPEDFEDCGLYYAVHGSISLPVSISPEEYEIVMKEQGTAEIVVNELTGETAVMEAVDSTDYQYGDCRLYLDGEEEPNHFFISYEPYSGTYELWHNSADTLFKPVYEGYIYVFKGAQEEYVNYFPLIPTDDSKGSPGAVRDIAPEEGHDTPFSGNLPAFDCNGYLRGLYYAGD